VDAVFSSSIIWWCWEVLKVLSCDVDCGVDNWIRWFITCWLKIPSLRIGQRLINWFNLLILKARLSYENFRTLFMELSTHSHIMLSESMKNLSMLINKWPYLIATCIRCGLQFFYHLMSAFSLKKRKMCYLTLSETIKCHYKSHNNYETLIKFHLKTHQQLYSWQKLDILFTLMTSPTLLKYDTPTSSKHQS